MTLSDYVLVTKKIAVGIAVAVLPIAILVSALLVVKMGLGDANGTR